MNTAVVDNKRRIRIPDLKPGQVLAWETSGNVVTLTPVEPVKKNVPVVKPVRGPDGLYRWPAGIKVSREEISRAIRADRDAQ